MKKLLFLILTAVFVAGMTLPIAALMSTVHPTEVQATAQGEVWAWGLDIGTTPVQVSNLTGIKAIDFTVALDSGGHVWTWGAGGGRLGNGTTDNSVVPVQVHGPNNVGFLSNITTIAGGNGHCLAMDSSGNVWAWGNNTYGQLGNGTNNVSSYPIQVSKPSGVTFTAISGGWGHSIALDSNGKVWAWGHNTEGELGNGTTNDSNVPVQVSNLTNIQAIDAGSSHNLAIDSNHNVWVWGRNDDYAELGIGTRYNPPFVTIPVQVLGGTQGGTYLTNIVAISAGGDHSFAIESNGNIWAWGAGGSGQLGNGTQESLVPIKVNVPSGVTFKNVSASLFHSLAIDSTGNAWAWGCNVYGQLGNGTTTGWGNDNQIPVMVSNLNGVSAICAHDYNSYAIKGVPTNGVPVIGSITAPTNPFAINTAMSASGTFTDGDTSDTHTAVWNWDDGTLQSTGTVTEANGSGSVTGTHTYTTPGVYNISLTISDGKGGSTTVDCPYYIVAYDPSGGFVTGGGWINSPAGAYTAQPALTGKATFGFVSKYQKGANVPTGNTEFQFHVANLNFQSTSYDWLVIAGARAQYKGSGTINGAGNYGFMLTAIDGQISGGGGIDKFRIKISDKSTGNIIYDNQIGASDDAAPVTSIAGGNIVIHTGK